MNLNDPIKHESHTATEPGKYPAGLMIEYDALIEKKLDGTITAEERLRLKEVRAQINTLDSQRLRPDVWDIQTEKLREEIVQLRTEVESLPDAH